MVHGGVIGLIPRLRAVLGAANRSSAAVRGRNTLSGTHQRTTVSTEQLRKAADRLESAREYTDDPETDERLVNYAERLRKMADADHGPDHGRLDRLTHNVRDLEDDLEAEGTNTLEQVVAHINAYRETVDGV